MTQRDYVLQRLYWPQGFPYWPDIGFPYWPRALHVTASMNSQFVVPDEVRSLDVADEQRKFVVPDEGRIDYVE